MSPSFGGGTGTPISLVPAGGGATTTAIQEPWPLLPLENWRQVIGYNPWHFWGLANQKAKITSSTLKPLRQYDWQDADRVGRSEILAAIENAEALLVDYLKYAPAPHFREDVLPWPKYFNPALWRYFSIDTTGHRLAVTLTEGYVQHVGIETIADIETVNVVPSDTDGDGLNDIFTLTTSVALGTTDPDEIAVYFKAADRLDDNLAKFRIQPVRVSIDVTGVATIKGPYWLLVRPILYEGVSAADLDPDTAVNFATQLEVKRRYTTTDGNTNATCQALITWETLPFYVGTLDPSSSTDPAATANAVARCGIRNAEIGQVTPAESVYDAASGTWTNVGYLYPRRPPDHVTVRYLAGVSLSGGNMQRKWQTIVARLAAAEMTRLTSSNDASNRELYNWQFDLSRGGGRDSEQFKVSDEDLSNPFGTRRGHLYAWRQVKNLALIRGILP